MNGSTVSTILRALLKWWWLIIAAVVLSVGVGYFVRTEQDDIYFARATVLVGQDARTAANDAFRANRDLLNAYSVYVRRQTILEPIIEDLNLGIIPDQLNAMMDVQINNDASLLEIAIFDTDAERAALIANRVAQELVNQSAAGGGTGLLDPDFLRRELANLESQISQLQDRYNELIAESAQLESAFAINQNIQESQSVASALSELRGLYAQYLGANGEVQRQVQLFEPAIANFYPVATNSMIDLVIAGAIGGILAVVTIVMITFMDDRFHWSESNLDDVEGIRVLGPLGIVAGSKLPLYAATAPESLEAEALRQVRAKIALQSESGSAPRVLTFVSNDSGDGKTLTTTNMALTYARSGEQTIVIDGDIRKGDIHELFRVPNVSGLSEILASKEPIPSLLKNTVLQTEHENLWLLPAGRLTSDPSALFSSARLEQLIDVLKAHYDVVIFDSAPTIAGQDAIFVGSKSDGVVIVVNARRTTQSAFRRTVAALNEGQNINILGLVVNRVRLQVTSKYSSSYYRHSPGISPDQLNRELLKPSRSGLNLRSNVLVTAEGERFYSVKISAQRLGVRQKTIKDWAATGYIQTMRRGLRTWVSENEIERLLTNLPVARENFAASPMLQSEQPKNGSVTGRLASEHLREQRNAVLGFAKNPVPSESDNS